MILIALIISIPLWIIALELKEINKQKNSGIKVNNNEKTSKLPGVNVSDVKPSNPQLLNEGKVKSSFANAKPNQKILQTEPPPSSNIDKNFNN